MGLTSNTGLVAAVSQKAASSREKVCVQLQCEVTPAPFMLRPYAGLYNPFSHACSVLCNHPADTEAKEYVKKAKDAWATEGKAHQLQEDLSKFHDLYGADKEKNKTPHDIVTEDMFRRYTETDSRPLTPAPTLASGKSRGSRRCLTPDQPRQRTTIVLDLRRSHSQETLYYHGYTTSELTGGPNSGTADRSTLPSLVLAEAPSRLAPARCEQLPPLASPLVLTRRSLPPKEAATLKAVRKSQLKALNLSKSPKNKTKSETPGTQRSKSDKETNDGAEGDNHMDEEGGAGESRRRGKRRRKARGGSDRLTSAGLAAQANQDPETQIAGIGSDSGAASSRGSECPAREPAPLPPAARPRNATHAVSFLDDDILKYLHREVDEDAIHTEFDTKRRYVLEEALRTRPERPYGQEMQTLLREYRVPAVSLGDWLHIPRVFSRQNAQFSLPIDCNSLETLTPMNYAARYVTIKKSKQLLYLTVLRKFRPEGYRMPIQDIEEGLVLMMGGIMTMEQAGQFSSLMEWAGYEEEENFPDDIKLTLPDAALRKDGVAAGGDNGESDANTLKYRTWCGVCAICERLYGRFPPRERDLPDGIELSDFTMLETKLHTLKVHPSLVEILNTIRLR